MSGSTDDRHYRFANLEEYVKRQGGTQALHKILIANNGISAVKAIRSIRQWCYETFGNEREITFVAMATPEDMKANAEYIRMADQFVEVPAGKNVNNYANVSLICQLAERYNVDAVWAGWGHASENPSLPKTLMEMGKVFIGPPAGPMYALGDKIGSTIIAQSAGVPTIAWNGQDLRVDYKELGEIPAAIYQKANVKTVKDCIAQVEKVGVPVMIKASEGGGGKGIRKVIDMESVPAAFRQVQSEIPGSPIFVMKLAPKSRHLEVQLLADAYGNAIALNGRDCSIQRRHQKILEEGPPIAAPPEVWDQMEKAAVRLAKEVGYINAGTVEYLFCDGKFFFLELNPRLQVEHPVTEMITQTNIPSLQLNVAMGIRLDRIPDIRRLYGERPLEQTVIDFDNRKMAPPHGHVIAARITAENPYEGFSPTSGRIEELNFRSSRNVWGYFSVDSSGNVHEFADSQFGHLFAWGVDREAARRSLVLALKDLSIRGDIRTTVEYLNDLIEAEDYKNNNFDTSWLDERIKQQLKPKRITPITAVIVGAACQAFAKFTTQKDQFLALLQKGQMPPPELMKRKTPMVLIYDSVKYILEVSHSGPNSLAIKCNESNVDVEVRRLADEGFLVLFGGKSNNAYVRTEIGSVRIEINGQTCLFVDEYDPTKLRAKMGGKLLRYLVKNNTRVEKNQPFAEIEVMKMNMQLLAQESGTIKLLKPEGSVMEPGDLICSMQLEDESKIKKAEVFRGSFPEFGPPWPSYADFAPHNNLEMVKSWLKNVLDGYLLDEAKIAFALKKLELVYHNPMLPVLELEETLSRVKNTLDYSIYSELLQYGKDVRQRVAKQLSDEKKIVKILSSDDVVGLNNLPEAFLDSENVEKKKEDLLKSLEMSEAYAVKIAAYLNKQLAEDSEGLLALNAGVRTLIDIADKYSNGMRTCFVQTIQSLVDKFVHVETVFSMLELSDSPEKDDELQELRRANAGNLNEVHLLCVSHNLVDQRNKMVIKLLQMVEQSVKTCDLDLSGKPTTKRLRTLCIDILRSAGRLKGSSSVGVALESRQLLLEVQQKPHGLQINALVEALRGVAMGNKETLKTLVAQTDALSHFLIEVVATTGDNSIRRAAMKVYIKRVYSQYRVDTITEKGDGLPSPVAIFEFFSEAESEQPGGMGSAMANGSSFEDLTALLSKGADETPPAPDSQAESSTIGLDMDGGASQNSGREARTKSVVEIDDNGRKNVPPNVSRTGVFAFFASLEELSSNFAKFLGVFNDAPKNEDPVNVIHAIIQGVASESQNQEEMGTMLGRFLANYKNLLNQKGIRRITFGVVPPSGMQANLVAGHGAGYYTYRNGSDFGEDKIMRNIETPLAFQLDLGRLANFKISLVSLGKAFKLSNTVHVYEAIPKKEIADALGISPATGKRYFVRALVRQMQRVEQYDEISSLDTYPGPEKVLNQCLEALESIGKITNGSSQNHIFLHVMTSEAFSPILVESVIKFWTRRYAARIQAAGVTEFEVRFMGELGQSKDIRMPMRVIASNPTGFALELSRYIEADDPEIAGSKRFYSINDVSWSQHQEEEPDMLIRDYAELHGLSLATPYPVSSAFDEKRGRARAVGTTYIYDYPALFLRSLQVEWKMFLKSRGLKREDAPALDDLVTAEELVLDDELTAHESVGFGLSLTKRPKGTNTVGMVAWRMLLKTPEYREGRQVIIIANDITFKAGSFGTKEDEMFHKASTLARKLGLPRLYVAANSGARIGMADEVMKCFQVKFKDASDAERGFDYIHLSPADYKVLGPDGRRAVLGEYVKTADHYKITCIVGAGKDLGVENLRGSGTIAGETSRAYDETFTLTYVSGRTVGIGAYLVRLGQRTIQKGANAPIILTGYTALNALMGKEVYSSNLQLGGPKVMYNNGVSHQCVRNDFEGVQGMIRWLSYVPAVHNTSLPIRILVAGEVLDRDIEFDPVALNLNEYDPRKLLAGGFIEDVFYRGFFDKFSFTEALAGWAKTVIIGRANLGGIPAGAIISEIRTVEKTAPADPAAPDTEEKVYFQAGQVWFPDSAFKTAQAIEDFNREGLPLFVFANWRGFSGGQRDMFDEVLKYGSYIVDALVNYKQPVFVYLVPKGELRGGAWVVVDETINPEMMEMYSDAQARGNVLEPAGAAAIKFRKEEIMKSMHRTDEILMELDERLADLEREPIMGESEIDSLKKEIVAREKKLFPVYKQISLHFADLHDRPGRMIEKGVVRKVIDWKNARRFFYWRLRRRLQELSIQRKVKATGSYDYQVLAADVNGIYKAAGVDSTIDTMVVDFLSSEKGRSVVANYVKQTKVKSLVETMAAQAGNDMDVAAEALNQLMIKLKEFNPDAAQQLLKKL